MPLKISGRVDGLDKVSGLFDDVSKNLKNFKEPLKEATGYMLEQVDKNFDNEGGVVTSKWKKLNPSYAKRKKGDQILVETGQMRASFWSRVGRTKATIGNSSKYFKYHQSKRPRQKIPRRVMLNIRRKQQTEIYRAFTKYLNKITR